MDDLEEVRQQFIADVGAYVEDVQMAADEARNFAVHAEEAKVAADGMRDGAIGAGEALGHVRDEAATAAESVNELGKQADQTAAQLDLMGLSGASTFTALGPMVAMIGGLVAAAAAVAPALGAATLGIGAFGAVAIPNYMAASQAATAVQNAQIAYNAAVANGTKQATAYKTEQIAIAKAYAQLSPAQIALSREIGNAQNAWQSFVQANTAGVSQILTQGIGLLPRVFSILQQLIGPGERAVSGLITAISQGLNSSGFRQFMQVMTSMVVPATQAITRLAFTILNIFGQAMEQLAPMSIPFINVLSVLLRALGGPVIAVLHVVISLFLGLATALEPLLPGLSAIATLLVNDVGSSFAALLPIISQVVQVLGGALIKILQELEPVLANALTPNGPFVMALALLPGLLQAIMPLLTGLMALFSDPRIVQLAVWVLSAVVAFRALQGALTLARAGFALLTAVMEVNPVILILTAIAALVVGFIYLWDHSAKFRDFWIGLWQRVQTAMAPVVTWVKQEIGELTTWWNAHWTEIREVLRIAMALIAGYVRVYMTITIGVIKIALALMLDWWRIEWGLIKDFTRLLWDEISGLIRIAVTLITGIIGIFLDLITGHWSKAWQDLKKMTGSLLHEIGQLFENVGRDWVRLFRDLGHNIIEGLINGIKSTVGGLLSMIGGIAHDISGTFSSILHIASPSRVFFEHGRNTLLGYIQGIQAVAPQVRAALAAVGGQVAAAGITPGSGGSLALTGGRLNVTVPVTLMPGTQGYNDPRLLQAIQAAVQEAILRYRVNNPGNGLNFATGGL